MIHLVQSGVTESGQKSSMSMTISDRAEIDHGRPTLRQFQGAFTVTRNIDVPTHERSVGTGPRPKIRSQLPAPLGGLPS